MLDFDLFDPAEMTGFVRALQFPDNGLEPWFPHRDRQDIEYAYAKANKRREQMARYRGFDVPAPLGDRPGVEQVRGAIPPLSKKLPITEWERLNLQRAQGNTQAAAMLEQLAYDDAQLLTESLQARIEFARGTVIQTGQVTFVTDEGFVGVAIDYGTVTAVTVPNVWSNYTLGKPLTDVRNATNAYVTRNKGRKPGVLLTTTTVRSHMLLTDELRNYSGVGATVPSILTPAQMGLIFDAHELPPIVTYDAQVNVPGVGDTPVLPANKAYLLPAPGDDRFAETTYGVTAEALELVGKGFLTIATAPGLVGVGMTEFDPVTKWTKVSGLAVPVCKDTDLITALTVTA